MASFEEIFHATMPVLHLYRQPGLSTGATAVKLAALKKISPELTGLQSELCFNVESSALETREISMLRWILGSPQHPELLSNSSTLNESPNSLLVEIGPRLNFSTAFSSNAVSVCQSVGLSSVTRLELSTRYLLTWETSVSLDSQSEAKLVTELHDRMTQCRYVKPLSSFELGVTPEPWFRVDVMSKGRQALEEVNSKLGLAFDAWDLEFYTDLFRTRLSRNPSSVECFDLAQSNSEHSRHWFFKGCMVVDGEEQKDSLLDMIIRTQDAIEGFKVQRVRPMDSTQASSFLLEPALQHIIFTAETHNFPTGVAPFRGGHYIAGTAGYSFGNLHIPEASNGASDYGNKFGEPVVGGFARSFGLVLPSGERREYVKPIMFSGGMHVVKLGGPVYRIGVGGGSASSVEVQGDNKSELDFGAVQRGDAEMEQKLHRVIRACLERGSDNPICSIHDQGAGGNGNVLKELVEPSGAVVFTQRFQLGDPTISVLELWGAEYQENDALLCKDKDKHVLETIAKRERCPVNFVGRVTGTGKVILTEETVIDEEKYLNGLPNSVDHPVDLDLELVLGKMPQKTYNLQRSPQKYTVLQLPKSLQVRDALERVLRLPSVASKRYLTNKVDRCVTGLIAQQQCVGPLHTPLADVAVAALSHFNLEGLATAIGEQPIKGLLDAKAGARMTVAESLTNLTMAEISNLKDVKCSGNWMWAAKLPGEGAALYDACTAMCDLMNQLGVAVDGGKDSLSMAARVEGQTVKAPGTLVVSSYAPCPDIRNVLTPDLKLPQTGTLIFVDLSNGKSRLGGTALAQCYKQLGHEVSDVENPKQFVTAFEIVQNCIKNDKILAGHDISDGGLITCILEMAFAGNTGLNVNISHKSQSAIDVLFTEELGWVFEVKPELANEVIAKFNKSNVPCYEIGNTGTFGPESLVTISVNNELVVEDQLSLLFHAWEETSFQLELLQCDQNCARQENEQLKIRQGPKYILSFDLKNAPKPLKPLNSPPKVAVLREEGINGDREMAASFMMAGFEVWDLTVQDLLDHKVTVDHFKGIIFPGGFSYADVLGSAKGWAASLLFHPSLRSQFQNFVARKDTFSLGVCNGCQLMALLGWIGGHDRSEFPVPEVSLERNDSERFECRFSTVKIEKSPSIMLQGMEGSMLGVWVAHGEGKFSFKTPEILSELKKNRCVAVKYVDDSGTPTRTYPLNPNGSPEGIAGICSPCGRHLALMPHPERCTLTWQWPYMPQNWLPKDQIHSPWLRIYSLCKDHSTVEAHRNTIGSLPGVKIETEKLIGPQSSRQTCPPPRCVSAP
ncbi:hypothetical protein B566_EDAN012493 [Ephemera danica]|nr:hypothetical protein B566_EDAN012493 [Ephemera danica]